MIAQDSVLSKRRSEFAEVRGEYVYMYRFPIYEVAAQKQHIGALAHQFVDETRHGFGKFGHGLCLILVDLSWRRLLAAFCAGSGRGCRDSWVCGGFRDVASYVSTVDLFWGWQGVFEVVGVCAVGGDDDRHFAGDACQLAGAGVGDDVDG